MQDKFDVIRSNEPDFLIYVPPVWHCMNYDCVRIFFTPENLRTDWNIADYGIDFDFMEFNDRHCRFPVGFIRGDRDKIMKRHLIGDEEINNKIKYNKFCAFMVSNSKPPTSDMRDMCFELLSEYKKVDSGGLFRNNVGGRIGNKLEWLKDYKFHLCFENSTYPGYLTEKLFDAFSAGCVPIYWGDTSLRISLDSENDHIESHCTKGGGGNLSHQYVNIDMTIPRIPKHLIEYHLNPKAFINAHNFPTLRDLIEEIKRMDNDHEAYKAMLREPVFLDNFNPFIEQENKLKSFLESICSQEPKNAFRRGEAIHLTDHRTRMEKNYNLPHLLKYYKLAKKINNILSWRTIPRDLIKKYKLK